jgi:tetratricopeptide (TPR) repeat protein
LLVALLLLVPLAIFAYTTWATRHDWSEAEAEAGRSDPAWRLHELIEKQAPIADKENSALHIIAIERKAKDFAVAGGERYNLIFESLPPNARLNAQQLELLRGQLGTIAKPLVEARRLKDMPRGRFILKHSDDFLSTLFPDHHSARRLADWLQHDAYLLAHEGKYDEAVQSCQACLNTGRTMADDLFLIGYLIRVANQTIAIDALERVLAQGEASDESLKAMQGLLDKETKESTSLTAIRGERAGIHMLFDNIRTGKVPVSYLRGLGAGKKASTISEWVGDNFPGTMLKYYPEHLRHMTYGVEIAKLPIHEQGPRLDEWDKKTNASRNPITKALAPALVRIHQAECRSQANLRTALVALACERYRLSHKRWPPTLDDLVKEKLLEALPVDPRDGRPLRFRRNKEHIVIYYSIGLDGVDHEGQVEREPMGSFSGLDMAFRLWDKEHRGAPPRPPVVLPEGQP